MAAARLVDELTRCALGRHAIAVIGDEPRLAYNRVLLSSVLAGETALEAIELKPMSRWLLPVLVIAISGRAVAISAETSIHGCKSEIGAARSPILRPGRKLIRRELAYGARAMPADMLSCSVPPIDACGVSFHRFPQSAVTSRECGGFHLTPCPPWSMLSTRLRERSRTESRRTGRRL